MFLKDTLSFPKTINGKKKKTLTTNKLNLEEFLEDVFRFPLVSRAETGGNNLHQKLLVGGSVLEDHPS